MDRISNLPDEIICHIGSFLSAKEAAFTTVLSKRWHNLFTIVPDLHFDCSVKDGESLTDFVDRVMTLPASSPVNKFSLKWWFDEDTEPAQFDQINRCLRDVLKRGVVDLYLWINGKQGYTLPFEVFTCETITKLSLGSSFAIDILPENALLPALKTLPLYYIRFYEFGRCAFKTLLDASPVLEELTVCGVNWELWKWSRTVSRSSLKRLTIMRKQWDAFDDSDFNSISFDTPSLAYLYYSDYVPKEYLSVNLDSLVETKLYLCPEENYMWGEGDEKRFNPMNLLHGLKNVETLNLYTIMTAKMFYVFREALPVFEKLSHLTVNLSNFCWSSMPMLIKKAPNLKTLNINLHYESYYRCAGDIVCECVAEYSFLVSCPLEVLKITEYYGCFRELMQMKHFLEKLLCLELVEIHSQATGERKLKLIADLQRLPRASSKCKFEVVS
ncbi:F-box/LRR-repeat protein At3g62440 isoform X2 [Arabidopsis lyrata subsp. lyrata]|uniref:F-box/LRR-repeat protein At3g62440 isoform X2 n=1 Tax=Arabidopsis lyrata subsp. lyrata TaxID=81972 RepID=UPI000A29C8C2|nr:F-box/LRR-repeat protein At3g62440 isoform X2 [Arabidopsis lyrata subsp. lyrata]|eukprot:XP_020880953.1 F-box/LRR-repeat protein At3g62440 isoform X2 [Arabidopsis lyrata subsp. lyrata]